jgi:hypothetical protein
LTLKQTKSSGSAENVLEPPAFEFIHNVPPERVPKVRRPLVLIYTTTQTKLHAMLFLVVQTYHKCQTNGFFYHFANFIKIVKPFHIAAPPRLEGGANILIIYPPFIQEFFKFPQFPPHPDGRPVFP